MGRLRMIRAFAVERAARRGKEAAGVWSMRDLVADWKRWSRSERVLAVLVTFLMVALPLGVLLSARASV